MPNLAINYLNITGPKAEIKKCIKQVKNRKEKNILDLNKIVPIPKQLTDNENDTSNELDLWFVENWGTHRNILDAYGGWSTDDSYNIFFASAYTPPAQAILQLSAQYPKLTFAIQAIEPLLEVAYDIKCLRGKFEKNKEYERPSKIYDKIHLDLLAEAPEEFSD